MPDSWPKAKQETLVRDSGRCLLCRATDGLDVHHRRARGMGGTSRPAHLRRSNLVTLCRRCHDRVEAHPMVARALGYRLDRGSDPEEVAVWAATLLGSGWTRLFDDGSLGLDPLAPPAPDVGFVG
jgi:5-methylcytosine-specific restriction protein A